MCHNRGYTLAVVDKNLVLSVLNRKNVYNNVNIHYEVKLYT